ncbi:MAG: 50S ribosomal protein L15 [Candidatus Bathyarchaeota archaeon]|nr:50S ribosomal protein L15 [Candidatus Bathyarchaeota archaeon]
MPHKLRKHRKMRGSRTQGYGRIGQHRDAGSKGNRKVGRHKHLWSKVVNEKEHYFGKHGFTSPKALHSREQTINLRQLVDLAQNQTTIDLTAMGYTKLLGTGKIAKPLNVTVPACSNAAQEKIKAAGGKIITQTDEEQTAEPEQ